jgi:acyl-CoA dehydrogenase
MTALHALNVAGPAGLADNFRLTRKPAVDFELPEEIALLKQNVRRFVDKELIPRERGSNSYRLDPAVEKELKAKAEPLGLHLFDVPEEFGGQGFGMMARVVVWEELSRSTALPSRAQNLFGPDVSPILYQLQGEMRERYLMPVINGTKRSCFAQTEPDAGADPGGMRTTAVRDGDFYVINGAKRFITNADRADFAQVFAKTDTSKGSKGGISCFIVDMNTPGIKLGKPADLMIDDKPYEIAFDDVRVPVSHRVGEEGVGFAHAQSWLNTGRIRHGARSIGVMERCLELATSYSKQRKTFGDYLSRRQLIQQKLVDSFVELHQLRLMVYHAAWKFDRGEDVRAEAFMCKFFGDEKSFIAADRCMQIHGGMGLSRDLPIERFFRDQRSMMITEGPNEVLSMALARIVLDRYG